ncbi:MAG: ATP-binding protein [Verrucomicrobiota bacterium]
MPYESEVPESSPGPTDRAEEDRLRLFNLSLDLLCVAGIDGYFRHVNPSWTRVLGWTREELLSRPVESFMHPGDRERTLAARNDLARGIPVRGLENRYLCKDGSYRWLSWQCTVEPGGTAVFGVARDITDRRQSDHENLILSKLDSAATLASGIAHDFNNLLTGLQLNLDMVELAGRVSPQQAVNLRQARESVEAARTLTQQLLAFARRDGKRARRVIQPGPLLRETFEVALRGTNLRGVCRVAPDLRPVEASEDELAQVVRNLVANAREAMPSGGTLTLLADNTVLGQEHGPEYPTGEYVRFSIVDQGGGIAPDHIDRVFDPYFSTKRRGTEKGMGLGLTICHAVVQKHGGILSITASEDGAGTAVHCYLPAARGEPEPTESAPVEPARPRQTTARVLVMDDEPAVRDVIEQTLVELGCEVLLAGDGAEALAHHARARADGNRLDLALLDLTVRGGPGGVEVLRELRERDPEIRAVLMTGYDREPAAREYQRHGFVAVLSKPFTLDDLRRLL